MTDRRCETSDTANQVEPVAELARVPSERGSQHNRKSGDIRYERGGDALTRRARFARAVPRKIIAYGIVEEWKFAAGSWPLHPMAPRPLSRESQS